MGHSDEAPYMYDNNPGRRIAYPYSNFNPKAVTQASYASLASTQTTPVKQNGPLINFNQHPDSYMIVPGHNANYEPMPANTKKKVTVLRWIQFFLKLHQEVGAVGLLVATICITQTQGAVTYLLRIPPAWDALVTLYSVVHLIRPAKARTPASSASYHFFSLFTDTGIIPFYAFIAMVANNNYAAGPQTSTSWSSFFGSGMPLTTLQQVIWIGAAAVGGLHLISCFFDVWLVLLFRKITRLPPDMNPLEDNLTSRRSVKHKHKNSEFSLGSEVSFSSTEKKSGYMSGSTVSGSVVDSPGTRPIPFGHSRNDSSQSLAFSPHNPESARRSRQQMEQHRDAYSETNSSPKSRYEVRPDGKLDIRSRSRSPTKDRARSQMSSVVSQSDADAASYYSDANRSTVKFMNLTPSAASSNAAIHRQQEEGLLRENRYGAEDDIAHSMPSGHQSMPVNFPSTSSRHDFAPSAGRHDSFDPSTNYHKKMRNHPLPSPLGMNPPTPPPQLMAQHRQRENIHHGMTDSAFSGSGIDRSLTVTSNATNSSSVYSESAPAMDNTATPLSVKSVLRQMSE